jgi:hypothetical protein
MRKVLIVIFCIFCALSIGAGTRVDTSNMQLMHTTAYYKGHHTANGSKVHIGGCACNPHLGDVAIIYTVDGQYLGMYECNDTGATQGLQNGTVIDVYRKNLTQCETWMKITGGKVYVLWVKGKG